jgi:hypothetical protein
VEVVPPVEVVVAELLVVAEVAVAEVVVLVEEELVVDDVVRVDVVAVVDVVEVWWHWRDASCATVEAAWLRLDWTVLLTVGGRFATAPSSLPLAIEAAPQLPAATPVDTSSRWLLRLAA